MSRLVLHIGNIYNAWKLRRLLNGIRTQLNQLKMAIPAGRSSSI